MRKFSIPFTWHGEVDEFIDFVKANKAHIDSVYFSLPHILNTNSHFTAIRKSQVNSQHQLDYRDLKTLEFVVKSLGVVKRMATINSVSYYAPIEEYEKTIKQLVIPFLQLYKIETVIITHFFVGKWIKEALPEIEIQTSCNDFQFLLPQMEIWKKELGVEVFNPPRETGRTPGLFTSFKQAGYKLKVMINDACLYGCPYHVAHAAVNEIHSFEKFHPEGEDCLFGQTENFFRGNWLLPRWLPLIDEYVEVYKIVGRGFPLEDVKKIVTAYINLDDSLPINELLGATGVNYRFHDKKVPCSRIPDKLLTCQRLECDPCGICTNLTKEFLV